MKRENLGLPCPQIGCESRIVSVNQGVNTDYVCEKGHKFSEEEMFNYASAGVPLSPPTRENIPRERTVYEETAEKIRLAKEDGTGVYLTGEQAKAASEMIAYGGNMKAEKSGKDDRTDILALTWGEFVRHNKMSGHLNYVILDGTSEKPITVLCRTCQLDAEQKNQNLGEKQ